MLQSAALLEALRRGRQPFPLLKVDWLVRGLSLGTDLCAPAGRVTDAGQITRITKPGGWAEIEYGSGIAGGSVKTVDTAVSVSDLDGSLRRMLDTYEPRGSAAAIYAAAPGLVEGDFETWFVGVVVDWSDDAPFARIHLKADDAVLRTPVPAATFNRTEWGSAEDGTIFGTHMPLNLGIYDARLITARGMVPAVNIRYDKDVGYWWLASVGHQVDIRRIHFDGEEQAAPEGSSWRILRGVWGQNLLTIIEIDEGSQPDEGVVVAFDSEGPDSSGLFSGAAVTNPVAQLRAILEEYVYRPAPLGAWVGAHPIIDAVSWDAAATFFDAHGHESARRFGGDQGEQSAAEVIQSFLDAYPWTRIDWTEPGTLAFTIIDPDDVDPDAAEWLDLEANHEGPKVPYARGDRREVYSRVAQPYMWSPQEQKFLSAYRAADVAATKEEVVLPIENPWSQGRFSQE